MSAHHFPLSFLLINGYPQPYITAHHFTLPYSCQNIGTFTAAVMSGKEEASSRVVSTFAEGHWLKEHQEKYDELRAYHSCLDPSRETRSSKPHYGSEEKTVQMVKDFFRTVPSWEEYGGMAAWYEPSEEFAKWMSKRCHLVKAELDRRKAMMNGKMCFRLTHFRERYDPLVWHTIVPEGCSIEALKASITSTGRMCFNRERGVSQTFFSEGKLKLRQCDGDFKKEGGEKLTTVVKIHNFIAVDGVYHVLVSGQRKRDKAKAKAKAKSATVGKKLPSPPTTETQAQKKTTVKGNGSSTTVKETPPPSPKSKDDSAEKKVISDQFLQQYHGLKGEKKTAADRFG